MYIYIPFFANHRAPTSGRDPREESGIMAVRSTSQRPDLRMRSSWCHSVMQKRVLLGRDGVWDGVRTKHGWVGDVDG